MAQARSRMLTLAEFLKLPKLSLLVSILMVK